MIAIEQLFDKLNIQDSEIKTSFELEGYKFWVNKGKGLIRRRQRAALAIPYLWDDMGLAEGKYDGVIESVMKGVVVEGEPPVDLSGDGFDGWLETLPEINEQNESTQLAIGMMLPRIVVMVILGKSQVLRLVGDQQDSLMQQNLAVDSVQKRESIEESQSIKRPLKKPVRALPKRMRPVG